MYVQTYTSNVDPVCVTKCYLAESNIDFATQLEVSRQAIFAGVKTRGIAGVGQVDIRGIVVNGEDEVTEIDCG
jgi:hypothetical protein